MKKFRNIENVIARSGDNRDVAISLIKECMNKESLFAIAACFWRLPRLRLAMTMKNTLAMTFSTLAFVLVLSLGITTESQAATTCAWEKDADGNDTTKLVISGSGTMSNNCPSEKWKAATEIEIQKGITSIAAAAFYDASKVTKITIPDSVKSIGGGAFSGMTGVTKLTLGDSITSIGSNAFKNMTGLKELNINTPNIPNRFSGLGGVTNLTIGDSVISIEEAAFKGMTGVTKLTIGDSITSIGGSVFAGMTGITSLTLPDSVTHIGAWAFQGMSGLKSLIIPDNIDATNWDNKAFNGYPTSVDIICLGSKDVCYEKLAKYFPKGDANCPKNMTCNCSGYQCISSSRIKAAENEKQCVGKYAWNETTGKCNRMTEWQCNDYRDENNKRKYYFNGNTCTKLPKNGKIACANSCYKINDGYCDRICYTPAEAAEIAKDSGNVVTLTFKK